MNSLIKAMLSLDRRSKSVDERKRSGTTSAASVAAEAAAGQMRKASASNVVVHHVKPEPAKRKESAQPAPRFLAIPAIELNGPRHALSRSFDEAMAAPTSPGASTKSDRASRVSFFRLSKIGRRIRNKLSRSRNDEPGYADDDDDADDNPTPLVAKSAQSSFESALPADPRRAHSSSPVAHNRIHVRAHA